MTSMPSGSASASRAAKRRRVDRLGELDVEVLGVALVPDRERQPEAHLRRGENPA